MAWHAYCYCYFAKGTLTLRNPSDHAASITLDAAAVFELPPEFAVVAPKTKVTKNRTTTVVVYELLSPYEEQRVRRVQLVVGKTTTLDLAPYEVLSFAGYSATTS